MKSVKEIAEMYDVTLMTVYVWIDKGLPFKIRKEIGKRPYKILDPKDVAEFLGLGIREEERNDHRTHR